MARGHSAPCECASIRLPTFRVCHSGAGDGRSRGLHSLYFGRFEPITVPKQLVGLPRMVCVGELDSVR